MREGLRGQLMLAFYRSGRQADALEVYRQTREILDEELGLAPSLPLQRLQEAILRQEPALEVSIEPPAEVAPPALESRKTVTVLVASRSVAEGTDPEAIRVAEARYLNEATSAIERHGGSVQNVLGDRVLAVFGVPTRPRRRRPARCSRSR